jgi:hypothetical protein
LDEVHAAFIQSGVSIIAASRDARNVPTLVQALGCRVSADRQRVTIFLAASRSEPLLENIRVTRQIAVVFTQPSTHRSIQLKGTDAARVPIDGGECELLRRYTAGYSLELHTVGAVEGAAEILTWCEPEDLAAVAFTPSAAFSQTPGPRAGAPLHLPR